MYGPSGKSLIGFILFMIIMGAGLGIGCEKGCSHIYKHLEVRWQP